MTVKRFLNLFAGLGGIRLPWKNCEVTAIEIEEKIAAIYKARYPDDTIIVEDAYKYLVEHFHEFHFISAGPPCPSHSKMSRTHVGRRYKGWDMKVQLPDLNLYSMIIFLNEHFRGDWVVENVQPFYDTLKSDSIPKPAKVGRHLFWSNKPIKSKKIKTEAIMYKYERGDKYDGYIKELCQVFKIDRKLLGDTSKHWGYNYDGIGQVLRNTIHPKIASYIWKEINKKFKEELF